MSTFKIVFIGDEQVGKTTFLNRHLSGEFTLKYTPTHGVEVYPLSFNTNYGVVTFNVWDTAGDESTGLGDNYFINADACVLFFDVTREDTYDSLESHEKNFKRVVGEKPMIICGNKHDEKNHQVGTTDFNFHRSRSNCYSFYVSAKSNYNFEKPFLYLARMLTRHPDLKFVMVEL
uniref:Ras family GTPase n=1 Tax=Marseillevirus LCMAC201 TaxID=2506605 RepID=A0A481YXG2_9VIRU|nr:MAG: Ras family GTPase [Marseillevirus LCMAC201]